VVRACVVLVFVMLLLSGCGTERSSTAESRIERCIDRLVQHADTRKLSVEVLRRYARNAYCARFEQRGWIYDDGALSIRVQTVMKGHEACAVARPGESPRTVPCQELSQGRTRIECALLRYVRRSEVTAYLERLESKGGVECDDGTPLSELGVP
jgi:hypothetical protein